METRSLQVNVSSNCLWGDLEIDLAQVEGLDMHMGSYAGLGTQQSSAEIEGRAH